MIFVIFRISWNFRFFVFFQSTDAQKNFTALIGIQKIYIVESRCDGRRHVPKQKYKSFWSRTSLICHNIQKLHVLHTIDYIYIHCIDYWPLDVVCCSFHFCWCSLWFQFFSCIYLVLHQMHLFRIQVINNKRHRC